ncbi:MAG: efflux RND transporter periplasmic adaptor subunit [Alphaproteobacteria bacterium]|nr:MAG: efflux RND transporter periplasmic adaptor subunit [Alphaproteobacteria bacterium]
MALLRTRRFCSELVAILTAPLLVMVAGCSEGPKQQPVPPPVKVTVARPIERTIVDQDEYVGRFVAVESVEIRARVSGYLEKVHFQDGQYVRQGDILFTIDKRSFQNTFDQASANLETAKSNLAFAEADLARGQQLMRERTISEQVFQQRSQIFRNAQAAVAANEALLRQAALDLEFTELKAPVSGRIGDRRVTPGNLVTGGTGGTTLLATIVSTDPIRLEFTFDEASLVRYERLAHGGHKDVTGRNTEVKLKLIDEQEFSHRARLDFVDNVIDRATGTIRGRAELSNREGLFTPGMFARVQVPASAPYQALLLPDAAIGTEQSRKYVLVLDADNIAMQRYVTLGDIAGGLRVVKAGLTPNDRVIINGLIQTRLGTKVDPQEVVPSPQASAPAAKSE